MTAPRAIGRYVMAGPIAVGGMASVHFGRLNGPVGFRRTVAIKRMLESYASNAQARAMLLDEARLAARVQHANVVQTLDVVEEGAELFLVLEYVHGESFDRLLERARAAGQSCPTRVVTAILVGALRGLHAAHEAKGEDGQPLELVHRDLSPHNIIVDVDGVARVLDFGVARARGRLQGTTEGQLKGKLAYLSPEQVHGEATRRSDVFAAGIVLWEALTGRRLFDGSSEADILSRVLLCRVPSLASCGVEAPQLQAVIDKALEREADARFATAAEMADALERCGAASASEVAAWVKSLASEMIASRAKSLEELDRLSTGLTPPSGSTAPAPRPRSVTIGAAVAVLALAAIVAAVLLTKPAPVAPAEPPRVVEVPPKVEPPPPVVVDVKPPPVVEPPRPAVTGKKPPPKVDSADKNVKPPGDTCNPPFVIDANGVKQFKIECLK